MAGRLISFQRNKATEAENSSVPSRDRLGINSIAEASRASERACPVACIITPLLKHLYPSTSLSFSLPTDAVSFPNVGKEKTNFYAHTQLHDHVEIADLENKLLFLSFSSYSSKLWLCTRKNVKQCVYTFTLIFVAKHFNFIGCLLVLQSRFVELDNVTILIYLNVIILIFTEEHFLHSVSSLWRRRLFDIIASFSSFQKLNY